MIVSESFIAAIRRFCAARSTSLILILITLLIMLIGSFVPQAFLLTPAGRDKWNEEFSLIAPIVDALGLNRIYTHPLFALVLVVAVMSLFFSSLDQFRIARRRMSGEGVAAGKADEVVSALSMDEAARLVRASGYQAVARGATQRYLRHPWGVWGNFLLHAGMLTVIVSSLYIALTQQRGLLHIARGETFLPSQPWASTETGLLAQPLVLDQAVRLEDVAYEYWPTNGVKNVASTISFLREGSPAATRKTEINSILTYDGLRVYQGTDFGHAFFVEVTDMLGQQEVFQLLVNHQAVPDEPSYNEYRELLGPSRVLRAKYLVDQEKRSLTREQPLLTLRVDEGGREIGQLPLKPGESGTIGPYRFRLLKFSRWTSLIFVKLSGIAGIFAGFCIIALGGFLNYFTPTREIALRQSPDGTVQVTWLPGRFGSFYEDEFKRIADKLAGKKADG